MTDRQKIKLRELRCKAWGITEDEYFCNQCGDFQLEDMARAYRRGKNKGAKVKEKELNAYFQNELDEAYKNYEKRLNELLEENKKVYERYRGEQDLLAVEMARSMKYEKQIEQMKEVLRGFLELNYSEFTKTNVIFKRAEDLLK